MHKKYTSLLFLFTSLSLSLIAQNKYDNTWVLPRRNLGGNILSFSTDTLQITNLGIVTGIAREALASMSDKDGNLLFYSNNCSIYNADNDIVENGVGMNPGVIQQYWCTVNPWANPRANSIISLPSPSNEDAYHILHLDLETIDFGQPGGSKITPLHFYNTTINFTDSLNNGEVISINEVVISDTLSACGLQAVRHANGRDWWIIVPEYKSTCYYLVLLSPSGLQVVNKQCLGHVWDIYDLSGGGKFTSDGSKYVRVHAEYGLNIFDFDRCTGELSNPIHIDLEAPETYLLSSMALSQSGRFCYYVRLKSIYQFDLEADDIESSKTLVATYDGFQSAGNSTDFYYSQLAPDGKIYMCTYGPTYYLHVIDQPDSAGVACMVKQHEILLPNRHYAAMPNYPNYRLGALPGPCDTLTVSIQEAQQTIQNITVYPNPVQDLLHIASENGVTLYGVKIMDITGRPLYNEKCRNSKLSISIADLSLPSGIYFVQIETLDGVVQVRKIVVK